MPTAPPGLPDPSFATDAYALGLLARSPYGRISVSMRALPFVTVARHVVRDGRVLLRLHGGFGYAAACDGSVAAYAADNLAGRTEGDESVWTVQFVGTARALEPDAADLELFGRAPTTADGAPFVPEYLCMEPQFITVHHLEGVPARQVAHAG
ncbi:pyridoxamine 5'-phosphate oxidase family protein [Streptomyces mashuensis]|nr:pyridoxamine 5'-phosphate oxidase family protein [Streptomyces mashuensis]